MALEGTFYPFSSVAFFNEFLFNREGQQDLLERDSRKRLR